MLLVALIVHCTGVLLLYYVLSRAGMPTAIVSGLVGLALLKHIGWPIVLIGPVYAWFRRRRRAIATDSPAREETSRPLRRPPVPARRTRTHRPTD